MSKGFCTRFVCSSVQDLCSAPVVPVSALVPLPLEWGEKELEEVERRWEGRLGKGGVYVPNGCTPTTQIAILVPYRYVYCTRLAENPEFYISFLI